jgi:hypothetical protein
MADPVQTEAEGTTGAGAEAPAGAPAAAAPAVGSLVGAVADAPAAPVRPEGLPDDLWDDAAGVKTDALLAKYSEAAAAEAARAADVPADVNGYELALPEGLDLPQGAEIGIDDKDPFLAEARAAAHELGLTKSQWTRFVALEAQQRAAAYKAKVDTFAAEKIKLGSNADARIEAVRNKLAASGAGALAESLFTAASVEAVEKLIAAAAAPAVAAGGQAAPPKTRDTAEILYGASPQR